MGQCGIFLFVDRRTRRWNDDWRIQDWIFKYTRIEIYNSQMNAEQGMADLDNLKGAGGDVIRVADII